MDSNQWLCIAPSVPFKSHLARGVWLEIVSSWNSLQAQMIAPFDISLGYQCDLAEYF